MNEDIARPRLSVCVITYNHGRYIRQAMDSVLMQRISFPWEIIVADDCSGDDTPEILRDYARQNPCVTLILREVNIGAAANFMDMVSLARGEYVTYLDGDDYWTDPDKLEKQINFLDSHPDCVACFHKTSMLDEATGNLDETEPSEQCIYPPEKVFELIIPSLTVVFRNEIRPLPNLLLESPVSDKFLWGLLSEYGKFADLGFVGSVYRKHTMGIWSSRSLLEKHWRVVKTRMLLLQIVKKETARWIKKRTLANAKSGLWLSIRKIDLRYAFRFGNSIIRCAV